MDNPFTFKDVWHLDRIKIQISCNFNFKKKCQAKETYEYKSFTHKRFNEKFNLEVVAMLVRTLDSVSQNAVQLYDAVQTRLSLVSHLRDGDDADTGISVKGLEADLFENRWGGDRPGQDKRLKRRCITPFRLTSSPR